MSSAPSPFPSLPQMHVASPDSAWLLIRGKLQTMFAALELFHAWTWPAELMTRSERLRSTHRRRLFQCQQVAVRSALAVALQVPARDITWSRPPGQMSVASVAGHARAVFSVTHCGEQLGIVISTGRLQLGLDWETADSLRFPAALTASCFTERERADIQHGTPDDLARLLFIWTAKEAFVKACGSGFDLPARRIEVDLSRQCVCDSLGRMGWLASWQWGPRCEDDSQVVSVLTMCQLAPSSLAWQHGKIARATQKPCHHLTPVELSDDTSDNCGWTLTGWQGRSQTLLTMRDED